MPLTKYQKPRDKKFSSREIKKELKNIYEDENGKLSDISRLEPTYKRGFLRKLIGLGLVLLVLAAVSYLGFWAFNKYAPDKVKNAVTDNGDVELTIEGPAEINANEDVAYVIKYKNKKKVALNKVLLNVRYPSGLLVTALNPGARTREGSETALAAKEDNWDIGALAREESGEIEISGRLAAEAGSNQNLWVVFYYEPVNFSSTFQTEASFTTNIKSSPIKVTVEGTTQLVTSDEVDLTIKYVNQSEQDLSNVYFEVDFPEAFTLTAVQPAVVEGSKNQWRVESLAKTAKGEINLKGKFAANVAGNQDFIIKTLLKESENKFYTLASLTHSIAVVSGDLLVELKVNGDVSDASVNFGDTLSYSLTYQNNGDKTLKDLTASVFFISSGEFIQWTTLNDRYDGTLDEFEAGKNLTWTKAEVPNLVELKPGDKGVIDFSVKLASNAGELSGDLNLQSIASIKVEKVGKDEVNMENKSNRIVTRLNSNLNLSAYGRYFDDAGAAIGSGPLPPRAGQTTRYIIYWQLTNSVHEVKDVTVTAILPNSVLWGGKKDITAGDISYQPESRKVIWTINRMPTSIKLDYKVAFELSVTPTKNDVGKILALTGDNVLLATDQVTGASISQARGSITTDLIEDNLAKSKGMVEN